MWYKVITIWKEWLEQRRKSQAASPQAIESLARDLVRLSQLAQLAQPATPKGLVPSDSQGASSLLVLHQEMETLADMAAKPAFRQVSEERRIALRDRLQRSRDYLIAAMQEGTPPTGRIQ